MNGLYAAKGGGSESEKIVGGGGKKCRERKKTGLLEGLKDISFWARGDHQILPEEAKGE